MTRIADSSIPIFCCSEVDVLNLYGGHQPHFCQMTVKFIYLRLYICLSAPVHICMYVFKYVYIIYLPIYVRICLSVYISKDVSVDLFIYVFMYLSMYVVMHLHM